MYDEENSVNSNQTEETVNDNQNSNNETNGNVNGNSEQSGSYYNSGNTNNNGQRWGGCRRLPGWRAPRPRRCSYGLGPGR